MSQNDSHEPVTVTDKRRIDPETGEIRDARRPGRPPVGRHRKPPRRSRATGRCADEVAELNVRRCSACKAEYDNYRKRTLRDQQLAADRTKAAVVTQLLAGARRSRPRPQPR